MPRFYFYSVKRHYSIISQIIISAQLSPPVIFLNPIGWGYITYILPFSCRARSPHLVQTKRGRFLILSSSVYLNSWYAFTSVGESITVAYSTPGRALPIPGKLIGTTSPLSGTLRCLSYTRRLIWNQMIYIFPYVFLPHILTHCCSSNLRSLLFLPPTGQLANMPRIIRTVGIPKIANANK